MNINKSLVVVLFLLIILSCPAWAGSRSVSINVSCTILPAIELASTSESRPVSVNTNLGNKYDLTEQTVNNGAQTSTLYSVTAL